MRHKLPPDSAGNANLPRKPRLMSFSYSSISRAAFLPPPLSELHGPSRIYRRAVLFWARMSTT